MANRCNGKTYCSTVRVHQILTFNGRAFVYDVRVSEMHLYRALNKLFQCTECGICCSRNNFRDSLNSDNDACLPEEMKR